MEGIKQLYLDCDSEQAKYDVLVKLYGLMTIGSSIIFVKVRNQVYVFLAGCGLMRSNVAS